MFWLFTRELHYDFSEVLLKQTETLPKGVDTSVLQLFIYIGSRGRNFPVQTQLFRILDWDGSKKVAGLIFDEFLNCFVFLVGLSICATLSNFEQKNNYIDFSTFKFFR